MRCEPSPASFLSAFPLSSRGGRPRRFFTPASAGFAPDAVSVLAAGDTLPLVADDWAGAPEEDDADGDEDGNEEAGDVEGEDDEKAEAVPDAGEADAGLDADADADAVVAAGAAFKLVLLSVVVEALSFFVSSAFALFCG